MSKTDRNEALASLAKMLRETDGEEAAPSGASEIRRAKRYLAGLGLDAEDFIAAYEGGGGESQPHVPLVDGLLDRLVESTSMDRGRAHLFDGAPEEPDLDRRVREIVRGEVARLKPADDKPIRRPAERRDKKSRGE
ncbi:MAG TPA: hypothetical protein VN851_19290 [Thermoanaerobaculia bacterium]|nr:hypothetical protein [Thermoanaerobaculia bacterium]